MTNQVQYTRPLEKHFDSENASADVVGMLVTLNSSFQNNSHPDNSTWEDELVL